MRINVENRKTTKKSPNITLSKFANPDAPPEIHIDLQIGDLYLSVQEASDLSQRIMESVILAKGGEA
jgi:hypothetical protein